MSAQKPLISIITPTYNAQNFIVSCIASVRAQRFADYEHIIIDGLSTDRTADLVREYAKKSEKIKLVVEKDEGIYDAMNKGIREAVGDWLYFLGADDVLFGEDVLEQVAGAIPEEGVQLIYGDVSFGSDGTIYDGSFDIEKILTRNICHQSIFYHASVFRLLGLYDLRYRTQADYDLNIRYWLSGSLRHVYIPVIIARFADGGASSFNPDPQLVEDYPGKTVGDLLASGWSKFRQVAILSVIYRKIYQRYPLRLLFRLVWKKDRLAIRLAAIAWMILSWPFYILKKD
jgi:glycosyltransferase involved in cell wall biosynthesis